jgi:hypothetical protein
MLLLFKSSIMIRYPAITFLALFITICKLNGQAGEKTETQSGELFLNLKSINFVKNTEYFNPVIEGYTLLGFFLHPEIIYSPSGKVILRGGIHLLSYSGTGRFSQFRPLFSATLNLSEKTSLTIGSLSGCDKHRLFDPHFNNERIYSSYVEDGFQLIARNDHISTDTWLSWENFIFKGDTTREVFTFGESFRYTSSPVADILQFEVPVQLQLKHFGGQISNYPEPVETFFNLATGLRINIDIAEKRFGQAGIEYLQFFNNELNGDSPSGISHGNASWLRFHYTRKALYIGVAYWKAHNFYAPNGNMIYGSVSDYNTAVVIPERKIITNSFSLSLLPESYFEIFLGLETYYDINRKRLDNAITLHLNFDKVIKLASLRK